MLRVFYTQQESNTADRCQVRTGNPERNSEKQVYFFYLCNSIAFNCVSLVTEQERNTTLYDKFEWKTQKKI